MKHFIQKILCNIKNLFNFQNNHEIKIDKGMFDVAIFGNHKSASNGTIITVFRITDIPNNIYASIKILDDNKKEISHDIISLGLEWSFVMPNDNVTIVPIIKRKH